MTGVRGKGFSLGPSHLLAPAWVALPWVTPCTTAFLVSFRPELVGHLLGEVTRPHCFGMQCTWALLRPFSSRLFLLLDVKYILFYFFVYCLSPTRVSLVAHCFVLGTDVSARPGEAVPSSRGTLGCLPCPKAVALGGLWSEHLRKLAAVSPTMLLLLDSDR